MSNIIDYAHDETRQFSELKFNEVDALILAQLTYESIPELVPRLHDEVNTYGTFSARLRNFTFTLHNPLTSLTTLIHAPFSPVTLEHMNDVLHGDVNDVCQHPLHMAGITDAAMTHEFVRDTAANPRFANLRVGAFAEQFDSRKQIQFAALTFLLPDGTLVISFRGTDDSLVGWKEDFNMAFQYPVPSQHIASEYVESVAQLWPGQIILTGHSKGGNSAVYAAMNVSKKVRERIEAVYSLDGPGFPERVVNSPEYKDTVSKVTKVVPDSSIIGMVLETPEPCEVIKADCEGIMQHFAFAWQVEGDRFVRVESMAASSREFNTSFNQWMTSLTKEQREHAVDAFFQVLYASGATTFSGLVASMPLSLPNMIGTIVGLTADERKHILEAIGMLVTAAMARNKDVTR